MKRIRSGISSFTRIPTAINGYFSRCYGCYFPRHFADHFALGSFGLFRMGLAVIGIWFIIQNWVDLPFLYGRDGLITGEINDAVAQQKIFSLKHIVSFFQWLFPLSELDAIRLVMWIKLFFLGCLFLGYRANTVALVCWLLDYSSIGSSYLLSYGYDMIYDNCLLFCIFLPIGSSVFRGGAFAFRGGAFAFKADQDQMDRRGLWYRSGIWLIRIHLSCIYLFSGLNKMMGHQWWTGEAIWRSVMQPPLQRWDLSVFARYPVVPLILSLGTLAIETSYPLSIQIRRLRPYFFCVVIGMHLFIAFAMNLFFFSLLMITYNIVVWSTYRGSLRPMPAGNELADQL